MTSLLRQFFYPSMNKRFFLRLALVSLVSYLVFGYLLLPLRIEGVSMEPTYHDGSFAFCWRLNYVLSSPQRFDVVAVRFAGRHVMLLKRIIALPGETLEYRHGKLYINAQLLEEPYVSYNSQWNLPERTVAPGKVYIIGDNRGVPMERHKIGQVSMKRIVGGVVF
ncbi:MAG: signal peptidase I [Desulfobulbus sp.]|nr:MAG: signal peptidase I [Desulfobulbus sp.]